MDVIYKRHSKDGFSRLTQALMNAEADAPLPRKTIMVLASLVDSPSGLLWTAHDNDFTLSESWNAAAPTVNRLAADRAGARSLAGMLEACRRVVEFAQDGALLDADWLSSIYNGWLGVPLFNGERLAGFVVLAGAANPREVTRETGDMLVAVGRHIAELPEARVGVKKTDEMAESPDFNNFPPFLMHELKNIMGQLALTSDNAERHRDNPVFVDDMLSTIDNAVDRIKRLTVSMREGRLVENDRLLDLGVFTRQFIVTQSVYRRQINVHYVKGGITVTADPEKLSTTLSNIINNACDAAGENGEVTIEIGRAGGYAFIDIRDDGHGMDEKFINERLFEPFETSRSDTRLGIGAWQARKFVQDMGGKVEVNSQRGVGTVFRIKFPLETAVNRNCSNELTHMEVLA